MPISPWKALEEKGVVIRQVDIREEDCTLDLDDLQEQDQREDQAGRGGLRLQRRWARSIPSRKLPSWRMPLGALMLCGCGALRAARPD